MNEIVVSCTNINKTFTEGNEKISPLIDINLTTHESELVLLMGPSGCGKTTLISIIGGILKQDTGECLVMNKSINDLPEKEKTVFRGKNIGFLFQTFNLIPTLTAIENAAIPLILNGYSRTNAFKEAESLLNLLDLEQQCYRTPSKLSGGEQQRVAIARAFIHKPKLILCDEPTSFLDHERGKIVMNILQSITKQNNCSLIVVSHDPRIIEFADRILTIDDGYIKENSK